MALYLNNHVFGFIQRIIFLSTILLRSKQCHFGQFGQNPKVDFIEKSSKVEQCAEPWSIREKRDKLIIIQALQVHCDLVKAMIKDRSKVDKDLLVRSFTVKALPAQP